MAKTTRAARRRAVSYARRSRSSCIWYAISAIVVVAGVGLILVNRSDPSEPTTTDHWHAAIVESFPHFLTKQKVEDYKTNYQMGPAPGRVLNIDDPTIDGEDPPQASQPGE